MSQDGLCLVNLQDTSSFGYVQWENPSLLNPYDIISDIIDDVTSTPKSYISRSIEFYDIQHGQVSKSIHLIASGLWTDPQVNISLLLSFDKYQKTIVQDMFDFQMKAQ